MLIDMDVKLKKLKLEFGMESKYIAKVPLGTLIAPNNSLS